MSMRLICGVLLFFALFTLGVNATESGPSNTVGFWKLEVHPGFTQISFPLLPADKTVNNVLAGQLTGGATSAQADQILHWNAATGQYQMCWYNSSTSAWQGDFNLLDEAESYWIYVQPSHPATQTIVTFGNVVEEPTYNMGMISPGYNAVGTVWAEPAPISLAGLSGFQGGMYLFQSDLIMSYNAGTGLYDYAWKNESGNWQGNLTQFEPLKGYWIYIAPGHPGFNWTTYPHPNPNTVHIANPLLPNPAYQSVQISPAQTFPAPLPPVLSGTAATPADIPSVKGGAR